MAVADWWVYAGVPGRRALMLDRRGTVLEQAFLALI